MFLYFYGPTVRVSEYPERFFRQLLIAARSFYITVHLKFKICKLPYTLHKLLEMQKIFFTPEKKKRILIRWRPEVTWKEAAVKFPEISEGDLRGGSIEVKVHKTIVRKIFL